MSFKERCYEILKKVPKGKVTTYKDIAEAIGTRAYRAVGTAMKTNAYAPEVPCHRVINSSGEVGNYNDGKDNKIKLLISEGIKIENNKIDLKKYRYTFRQ